MADLVDRYIHQVGRYLAPKERLEIEKELRSQIYDQLDDRYSGTPSQADVAAVLAEFGDPRRMASSYNTDRYLIGPELYPAMMMVLRIGWLVVPALVLFFNVFGALAASQPIAWPALALESLIAALQVGFIFSSVVVLIFAIVQHAGIEADKFAFNPLSLPKVDDPRVVDRFETIAGTAIGSFLLLALAYFLHVGGLTLRFNLSDPGPVIPAPAPWIILLMIFVVGMLALNLWVLRRNRWDFAFWMLETALELLAMICLYFVLMPVFERFLQENPALAAQPLVNSIPKIIVVCGALMTVIGRGGKQAALWAYRSSPPIK